MDGQAVIRRAHLLVQSSATFAVFICMAHCMVASGDGASEGDLLAYNELVRAHTGDDWCMFHADVVSRMSEMCYVVKCNGHACRALARRAGAHNRG